MDDVRSVLELGAALFAAGGGVAGLAFGLLRLRRSRRDGAQLLLDLLAELIGNREAITSWWRGGLVGFFRPRSLPTLAGALRNDIHPTRTPREWHRALKDDALERDLVLLYGDFARVKRGETLIAWDWEFRLDAAAARVRARLSRRRRLDVLVGAWHRLPPLPQRPPSAPASPAELQQRALARVADEPDPYSRRRSSPR